jgi:hypothetical protein
MTKNSNNDSPIFYYITCVYMQDEFVYIVITNMKFKLRYYLNENNVFTITRYIYKLILTKTAMTLSKNTKVEKSAVLFQNSAHIPVAYSCEETQNHCIQI